MNKNLFPILLIPSCILAIPAVAMALQVDGWHWGPADFGIMWVLIASVVAGYKFLSSKAPNGVYRGAAGLALLAGFLLFWVNAAVGLIGSEENPANLLYGGVLVVGLAGAAIARLRPLGMAWTMLGMAAAQFLVPVVALIAWRPDFSPGVAEVFALNFGFVMMFLGSALLFHRAGSRPSPAESSTPA